MSSEMKDLLKRAWELRQQMEFIDLEYDEKIAPLEQERKDRLAGLKEEYDRLIDQITAVDPGPDGTYSAGPFRLVPKLSNKEIDPGLFRDLLLSRGIPERYYDVATVPATDLVKTLGQDRLLALLREENLEAYRALSRVTQTNAKKVIKAAEIDLVLKPRKVTGYELQTSLSREAESVARQEVYRRMERC